MRDDWKEKKREWSDKNKYSSFNSYKGLAYYLSHYAPISKWTKGEGKLPAPIELSLDPSHLCNYKCGHCNAQRYLRINPHEIPGDRKIMTEKHLKNLLDFVSDWGVKGVCIGGGGEPLTNKNVWNLPSYISERGMESSFATNGSLIDKELAEEMMYCKWIGVSVDSGNKETFHKVHGVDLFDKVIDGLRLLVKTKEKRGSNVDIAYKFLIRPDNWESIVEACKLAKDIGVKDFHARPVDLERKDFKSAIQLNYDIDSILEKFSICHEMGEESKFRVFTIMHKYDPNFRVKHNFEKCVSAPLMMQCCSDGNVYVCADHRIEKRFKLGSHYPDPKKILDFWGSSKHRKLLDSINVDKECGRCTYGEYARQIEEVAMEDGMCLNFP